MPTILETYLTYLDAEIFSSRHITNCLGHNRPHSKNPNLEREWRICGGFQETTQQPAVAAAFFPPPSILLHTATAIIVLVVRPAALTWSGGQSQKKISTRKKHIFSRSYQIGHLYEPLTMSPCAEVTAIGERKSPQRAAALKKKRASAATRGVS